MPIGVGLNVGGKGTAQTDRQQNETPLDTRFAAAPAGKKNGS